MDFENVEIGRENKEMPVIQNHQYRRQCRDDIFVIENPAVEGKCCNFSIFRKNQIFATLPAYLSVFINSYAL